VNNLVFVALSKTLIFVVEVNQETSTFMPLFLIVELCDVIMQQDIDITLEIYRCRYNKYISIIRYDL